MFTAAVLCKVSRSRLLEGVKKEIEIPEEFELIAHHLTIHMGKRRPKDKIGAHVAMLADAIGLTKDRVFAVRISEKDFPETDNKTPHVTIAVNRRVGAKPVESNQITSWKEIKPILLFATIEECP